MDLKVDRLKPIQMLVLDVDGVLTDCRVWLDASGEWRRYFSLRDGLGMKSLQAKGYKIAIITASDAEDIRERAKKLAVDYFYEGSLDKFPAFLDLQKKTGLAPEQIAYMGDDLPDLPILKVVGFAATVPEAMSEVKKCSHYITQRPGGNGAVREVCDFIYQHGAFA
jgi:3-deoxy-D-manno-octulosonate 8-phosphate phosphatase (KDO 8-P phosphatase)